MFLHVAAVGETVSVRLRMFSAGLIDLLLHHQTGSRQNALKHKCLLGVIRNDDKLVVSEEGEQLYMDDYGEKNYFCGI